MSHLLNAFADELTKEAGPISGIGKALFTRAKKGGGREFSGRRAIGTVMGGAILASTGMAAAAGRQRGLHGGEEGRYIAATRHGPSRAAFTNYHKLFKHKPTAKQLEKFTKHHKASTFASYRTSGKGKGKGKSKNKKG
jgi:hypothetical protein